jgi:hypothetical protein
MKTLLVLLALYSPTAKHYHFSGLYIMGNNERSCGAADRMMKEHWHVVIDDKYDDNAQAWVNRVKWQVKSEAGNEYVLEYKADTEAFMSMSMEVSPSIAYVTLSGINKARKPCHDTVALVIEQ